MAIEDNILKSTLINSTAFLEPIRGANHDYTLPESQIERISIHDKFSFPGEDGAWAVRTNKLTKVDSN